MLTFEDILKYFGVDPYRIERFHYESRAFVDAVNDLIEFFIIAGIPASLFLVGIPIVWISMNDEKLVVWLISVFCLLGAVATVVQYFTN